MSDGTSVRAGNKRPVRVRKEREDGFTAASEIKGGNQRKVQVRRAPRVSFTEALRQVFLDHLAACCNVKRAAEAAGVGVTTVYEARRRDPGFAQAWDEALEVGYATLEALLIERAALGGHYVPGETPVPGPETIDTWLALDLLRLRGCAKAARKPVGAPVRRADEKETTEAILAGLDVLKRRRTLTKGKARTPEQTRKRRNPSPRSLRESPSPARGEGSARDE